jgi:hypothetical protein
MTGRETWRLAELLGILRSDRKFLHDYDARLDTLLAENRIAVRDGDGCLAEPPNPIDFAERVTDLIISASCGASLLRTDRRVESIALDTSLTF